MVPDVSSNTITRDASYDDMAANSSAIEGIDYYVPPPPKPNVLEELNAQLAPYLPPGSNRESAFFKSISRADKDRVTTMHRQGLVDVNYDPKMTHVRKKPLCFVRIDPTSTVKKLTRKVKDVCSKGANECRHSNMRMA